MLRATMLLSCMVVASASCAGELGIDGTRFTLDSQRVFLLGVSYYGGCARSPELMARDFADLRERGVNWVRVWATWDMYFMCTCRNRSDAITVRGSRSLTIS